jgi:hypothetical protein
MPHRTSAAAAFAAVLATLLTAPLHAGVTVIPGTPTSQGGLATLVVPDPLRDDISPADRARVEAAIARYEREQGPFRATVPVEPPTYPFFPQAGIHGQDLMLVNFADLDPGSGIRDWDCSGYAYNGHQGHDSAIRSFREQAIGVPVYAALDGRVVDAHDGEPDMSVELVAKPANFVVLDHGDGYYGLYWHFKRGSVAVKIGQTVAAGTQIGLTGSSGYSSGPHLHFESRKDGKWFEPSAGPCRDGLSSWVNQLPVFRSFSVSDFYFAEGAVDVHDSLSYFLDATPRVSMFPLGRRRIGERIDLYNLAEASTYRYRVLDPSGTQRLESSGAWETDQDYRIAYGRFSFELDFDAPGTWRFQLDVNGARAVDAPFTIVANANQVKNRPPARFRVSLTPARPQAGQVMICQVQTSRVFEDPDYDQISYRYEWKVNGRRVRTVTSAALSDILARDKVRSGDRVSCKVTAADDRARSTAAQTMAIVAGAL